MEHARSVLLERKISIDTRENNDSFFPCSKCGLLYRRKDNLYRHLKEKHQSGAGLQNQPVHINHPDQYYTITKEKGMKTSRFNTESNEYSYVQLIKRPECTRNIENPTEPIWLYFNRCDHRNAGRRFSPSYPWMSRFGIPIRLPFMQMNQLTSELLLAEMERVLQSNEQFVLDHCVQLNTTHVSLPKGGTRKRCDYVDTRGSWKINVASSRYKTKMTCVLLGPS